MPSSPPKRRRTRGVFADRLLDELPPQSNREGAVIWPAEQLPIEIFHIIMQYLPRSNIQQMRLVNKEFEKKVSAYLFRVVVVPFRPDIYGIAPKPPSALGGAVDRGEGEPREGAIMLQDKGMRVFHGFGEWIYKFAMSFEFEESKLANPPVKCDQEAITSFWGIYRWPYKRYNRYAQLEKQELVADETRTMAAALRYIINAKELGLSIDGGLGWLSGPDTNQRVLDRGEKLEVFGQSDFVPEPRPTAGADGVLTTGNSTSSVHNSQLCAAFERMLYEAGYRDESLEQSVRMLLETEVPADLMYTVSNLYANNTLPLGTPREPHRPSRLSLADTAPSAITTLSTSLSDAAGSPVPTLSLQLHSSDEDDDAWGFPRAQRGAAAAFAKYIKGKADGTSLKPNDLTNAQKEMLLEISWAQVAFMQSYSIAVIDNPEAFASIETLTIARLPHKHLPTLNRKDFWDSLQQLKRLSLAIIPDWREISKLPTSWVQDTKIAPSTSVTGVYNLLSNQISSRKNIKSLHFEWLCGGEYAPGLFTRNQQILSAPIVSESMNMVNTSIAHSVLTLPYIEDISLKNCWSSPHIMSRFTIGLKEHLCKTLSFDSVSLTANIPLYAQPNPLPGGGAHHQIFQQMQFQVHVQQPQQNGHNFPGQNAQNGNNQPNPTATVTTFDAQPEWLDIPRLGSWPDIIDALTPSETLADIRYSLDFGPEPPFRKQSFLSRIKFKSCGYLRLPLDFDQSVFEGHNVLISENASIVKRCSDIESYMLKSSDPTLGFIYSHIPEVEALTLTNAFNMTMGWSEDMATQTADAVVDGIVTPGRGRFNGSIPLEV